MSGALLSLPSGLTIVARVSGSMGLRPWLSAAATPWLFLVSNLWPWLAPLRCYSWLEIGAIHWLTRFVANSGSKQIRVRGLSPLYG